MSAIDYHDKTGYERHSLGGHPLDWANQPSVLKEYRGLERAALPEVTSWPTMKLSQLLAGDAPLTTQEIDKTALARVLALSHRVTATVRHGGMPFHFRNVASAGALYPFEVYVATAGVRGIADGLYHQGIVPQSLTCLRRGNPLPEISAGLPQPLNHENGLVFFLTCIFFRSAWKYRERSYRYDLLDTGHLLESVVLALRAEGLESVIQYDFDDDRINGFLGLAPTREGCLAVVTVKLAGTAHPRKPGDGELLDGRIPDACRCAPSERSYPEVAGMHADSSRIRGYTGSGPHMEAHLGLEPVAWEDFPVSSPSPETGTYADTVQRRRSSRNFVRRPMDESSFGFLLQALCAPSGHHRPPGVDPGSVGVGMLVASGEGSRFFLVDRARRRMGLVSRGTLMERVAEICLGQGWLANCSAHVVFMSNIETIESLCGPRGYRYAMLVAGRLGQRIYLAATAMKVGCCGIGAFYDQEAASLLGLGRGSRVLYLLGVGPIRKWSGY